MFTINDKNVGKLSAVKIRLAKKGLYEDFWHLRQVRQQSQLISNVCSMKNDPRDYHQHTHPTRLPGIS